MDGVMSAFRQKFKDLITSSEKFKAQYFHKEFSTFVNLQAEDFALLPDMVSFKFLKIENDDPQVSPLATDETEAQAPTLSGIGQADNLSVKRGPLPLSYDAPDCGVAKRDYEEWKLRPEHERLNIPPNDEALRSMADVLYNDVQSYNCERYPSQEEYNRACESAIRKYPNLTDRTQACSSTIKNAAKYRSLKQKLRTKFKTHRSKFTNDPLRRVLEAKYGISKEHPGYKRKTKTIPTNDVRKRRRGVEVPEFSAGQPPEAILQHQKDIQKEWNKTTDIDLELIKLWLDLTAVNRFYWMTFKDIADVLDQYPPLYDAFQLICECERQLQFSLSDCREEFFSTVRVNRMLDKIKTFPKAQTFMKALDKASHHQLEECRMAAAMALLPCMFREQLSHWCLINKSPETNWPFPIVKIISVTQTSFFVDEKTEFHVYMGQTILCKNATSLAQAFDCVIAGSLLFDFDFPHGSKKTWRFVMEQMCKITLEDMPKPSDTYLSFIENYV